MTTRTQKETIAYLEQYLECSHRIARCQREIERNISMAYSVTATLSEAQSGTGSGRGQVEPATLNFIILLNEIGEEIVALKAKRENVLSLIDGIEAKGSKTVGLYRTVLELRYLGGFDFGEIAEEIGKTERHTYRVHEAAIDFIAPFVNRRKSDESEGGSHAFQDS